METTTTTTDAKCAICHEELVVNSDNSSDDNKERATRTLPCNHQFHTECINQWIELRNLCPLCRKVADASKPVRHLDNDDMELTMMLLSQGDSHQGLNLSDIVSSIFGSGNVAGLPVFRRSNSIRQIPSLGTIMSMGFELKVPDYVRRTTTTSTSTTASRSAHAIPQFAQPGNHIYTTTNYDMSGYTMPTPRPFSLPNNITNYMDYINSFNSYECTTPSPECQEAQCAHCLRLMCIHDIKRCTGCRMVRYCNPECQRRHWDVHREECLRARSGCSGRQW